MLSQVWLPTSAATATDLLHTLLVANEIAGLNELREDGGYQMMPMENIFRDYHTILLAMDLDKYSDPDDKLEAAVRSGYEILVYTCLANGSKLKSELYFPFILTDDLDKIDFLYNIGCPTNNINIMTLASGGHLDCLKYFWSKKFPCLWSRCVRSSEKHPECAKFLRSVGVPFPAFLNCESDI
jgi:hypothetical protein